MKKNNYIVLTVISLILLNFSCREEIELETESFESVLVVEATITNELKRHEVKVSRTFLLEETEQVLENNAEVRVTDNTGNSFNFSQNSEGVYVSDSAFEALPNIEYTLLINTTDGKSYTSTTQVLTPISQIDNVYPEFVNDNTRGNGIQVFLDTQNSNPDVKYFRYEFKETYKIVTPLPYSIGVNFTNYMTFGSPCGNVAYDVEFFTKTEEEEICFTSNKSNSIIQASSTTLSQNNIIRFPMRFIKEDVADDVVDASILRERYSINVRQYVQTIEAYNYYIILNIFGNTASVLSETQPGFVEGNLTTTSADSDRIIGFFEVASVSERRVFFNYQDVGIPFPNYLFGCDQQMLDFNDNENENVDMGCDGDPNERNLLYFLVTRDNYKLTNYNQATNIYTIARQQCVNCTSLGTNIQPDFWID